MPEEQKLSVSEISRSVRTALIAIVAFFAAILFAMLVIGGAYFLSLHAINANNALNHRLTEREKTAAIRSGLPTCVALGRLAVDADQILKLPGWNKPVPPSQEGGVESIKGFFADFPAVYNAAHCPQLIAQAKKLHIKD